MNKSQAISSIIALLMFLLDEQIIELTNVEAKVLFLVIGAFLVYGFSIPEAMDKLKQLYSKFKDDDDDDTDDDVPVVEIDLKNK